MTKADILAGLRQRQPVAFEAGGLTVWLRPWSIRERAEFFAWLKDNPGAAGRSEKLAALSLCDEAGALLFDPAGDLDELAAADGQAMEKIAGRVLELNGIAEQPAGKAGSTAGPN